MIVLVYHMIVCVSFQINLVYYNIIILYIILYYISEEKTEHGAEHFRFVGSLLVVILQ